MGIFGHKSHDEYLFCFENLENTSQDQQMGYSYEKCEYDECPFLPLRGETLCNVHQKDYENIQQGRQPDEDQ